LTVMHINGVPGDAVLLKVAAHDTGVIEGRML
jgi:hypothetical protein